MYHEIFTIFLSVTLKGAMTSVTHYFVLFCTLLTLRSRDLYNLYVNFCKLEVVGSANWCILFCDHKSQWKSFFITDIMLSWAFEIRKAGRICLYNHVFSIGYILHKAILSLTCGPILHLTCWPFIWPADLSFAEQVESENVCNVI